MSITPATPAHHHDPHGVPGREWIETRPSCSPKPPAGIAAWPLMVESHLSGRVIWACTTEGAADGVAGMACPDDLQALWARMAWLDEMAPVLQGRALYEYDLCGLTDAELEAVTGEREDFVPAAWTLADAPGSTGYAPVPGSTAPACMTRTWTAAVPLVVLTHRHAPVTREPLPIGPAVHALRPDTGADFLATLAWLGVVRIWVHGTCPAETVRELGAAQDRAESMGV